MIRLWHHLRVLFAGYFPLTVAGAEGIKHVAHEGATISASVEADGTEPFTYQWRRDGLPIPGATTRQWVLTPARVSDSGNYDVIVRNELGSTSAPMVEITVLAREVNGLRLTIPPSEQAIALGHTAAFAVVAVSDYGLPIAYQWRRDGLNLPGATSSTLTLPNVAAEDFGRYSVLVSTPLGSILSAAVRLRLPGETPLPPVIVRQPRAVDLTRGGTLALAVGATPENTLSYQWYRDHEALSGATTSTLLLANASPGTYQVVVSNSAARAESIPVAVTATSAGARLANLSARGPVGPEAGRLIAGFVLAGSGERPVLLRGIGPALAAYGVGDAVADPGITVLDAGGRVLLANDNWEEDPAAGLRVRTEGAAIGAFPLPSGSADAGLLATLPSGAYTLEIGSSSPTTGVALAEVYDAGQDSDPGRRLSNLSARGWVGEGGMPLVAGLVVTGHASRTVLVRAVGPGLGRLGVEAVLRRPTLQVFDYTPTLLASNSAWEAEGNGETLREAMIRAGAFALNRGSADAVVVLTLAPGVYTARVGSLDGVAGRVLLEIYELP